MTHDAELVPLQHLLGVLPWAYQSVKNVWRSPQNRKKFSWVKKADNGRLMVDVGDLKALLLVLGQVHVAYAIEVRVEQLDRYGGAHFRHRKLYCPFGAPGCRAMTCVQCQLRFHGYQATHTLTPM